MAAAAATASPGAAADMMEGEAAEEILNLEAVIGFNGHIASGLILHPDGEHIIFPLGSTVVIKNVARNEQAFLQGHTDRVTCLALSPDGKYIASGQATSMGFRAPVMMWDFEAALHNANTADRTGELVYKMALHKGKVQDVAFSADGQYLASLGGEDDNSVVIWDLSTGDALCGSPAASHATLCVRWLHNDPLAFVTAGQTNLRRWELNLERRRVYPTDLSLGSIRRTINCVAIDPTDHFLWCGTASGDVLEINLSNGRFVRASKNRFSLGTTSIAFAKGSGGSHHDFVICGNGDGSLARLSTERLQVTAGVQLLGGVSSVTLNATGDAFYAGTADGNRYWVEVESFEPKLRATSHAGPIHDVIFPKDCSDLFLTAARGEVRLWSARSRKELLRVQVPNLECHCVAVSPDGSLLVTGWQDGRVRAFLPESGKVAWVINDAHAEGVTCVTLTHAGDRLVTGGADGRVRVWDISGAVQRLLLSWKEHKRVVTDIVVSRDDDEAVSASADGACIVWNLRRGTRQNALFASTVFRAIRYHPDESQLLTCGSDRKVGYWDTTDCTAIRVIEASTAELMSVDISADGTAFAAAGADRLVKVWLYDDGLPVASGAGHSGTIARVRIAPDASFLVSVGDDGAIMLWTFPDRAKSAGGTAAEERKDH